MSYSEHEIDEFDEFDENYKSKTDVKREMREMQEFALRLFNLSKAERKRVPFDEDMLAALALADKIKNKPEALRRHARFVAKVLCEMDLDEINQALDLLANKHQQASNKHLKLEALRDQLIAEGEALIESLLAEHSGLERQKLRQLVRQANKEVKAEKTGKSYRDLFAYLKEHVSI